MSSQAQLSAGHANEAKTRYAYHDEIERICALRWGELSQASLTSVAWAYYYFSLPFRENLEIARKLFPDDERLLELDRGERDTDNLSPWPGVVKAGERVNHDEFMRRTLLLCPIADDRKAKLETLGKAYLDKSRACEPMTGAISIASYEDGGLEAVFGAMLRAPHWDTPLLKAFQHFLAEHIRFDSDPDAGHGALARHLMPDDRVLPLWQEFRKILVEASPDLAA